MDPEQGGVQNDYGPVGDPRNRPVLNQAKSAGKNLLFLKPKGKALGSRCPVSELELGPSICFPASSPYSSSAGEGKGGRSKSDPHCTVLAQKVHSPQINGSGTALGTAREGGSISAGTNIPSPGERAPSDGLAFERQILLKKGFSDAVITTLQKSKKPVTYGLYYKVWRTFERFCINRHCEPEYNINNILNFLQKV